MSSRAVAQRAKAFGVLLALYVLSGRWALDRLTKPEGGTGLPSESGPLSLLELRLWIILALLVTAAVEPQGSAPDESTVWSRRVALASCLFLFYMGLSSFWSPDPEYFIPKAAEMLMMLLTGLALHRVIRSGGGQALRGSFWATTLAVTGALGLLALKTAVASGPARLAVLGGGPNVFGRMMGLLFLASLYFWRRGGRSLHVGAGAMALILVILSGSRGSIVALAAGAAVFFAAERVRVRRLAVLAVLGCGLLGLLFTFTSVGQAAVATYELRVNKLLLAEGYTSGRDGLYLKAWELGTTYPVAGAGLASFATYGDGPYPHNFFLEVFSEGGLLGVAALLPLFAVSLLRAKRLGRRADGAALAAAAFMLSAAQFSGDLYDTRGLFVFLAMAAVPKEAGLA